MKGEGRSLTAVLLYLFKYFSCSPSLFLHFDFLQYRIFILVAQSSFAQLSSLIFPAPGWLKIPTLSLQLRCQLEGTLQMVLIGRHLGESGKCCTCQRTRAECVTLAGTFSQGQPTSLRRPLPKALLRIPLPCGSVRNQTFHRVFVLPRNGFTDALTPSPSLRWP